MLLNIAVYQALHLAFLLRALPWLATHYPALTALFPSSSEIINTLWSLYPQDLFTPSVGPDTKWQLGPERELF